MRKCWPGEMESGAVWCVCSGLAATLSRPLHWALGERGMQRAKNGENGFEKSITSAQAPKRGTACFEKQKH